MITGELKNKIDGLWDIFAAGRLVNPLDVIEQVTYLMFIRDLDDTDNVRAKEAFAVFLNDANLDSDQIYFVNQIVEYIVHNGMMKDFSVMQEAPFTDHGSITEIFTDMTLWYGIITAIKQVNANALAA